MTFFDTFEREWGPRLGIRRETFLAIFEYLATLKRRNYRIIETGCARSEDNWDGDGQSTVMFDRFVTEFGGTVDTVDIDAEACAYARSKVGDRTTVHNGDSVAFLHGLAPLLTTSGETVDFVYLDSHDLDWTNSHPSALHHLKELCAIAPALRPGTLVVVDDSFCSLAGVKTAKGFSVVADRGIQGKAQYVAEYFEAIGVPLLFEGYQCGWALK